MPKKGENIYKRKDGRWEGRYIRSRDVNGKAEYGYIYGKTYSEVKQKLLRMKVMPQQRYKKQSKQTIIYSRLLDDWLQFSRLKTKESTHARYSHLIEKHIKPSLGDLLLLQLTNQVVENFVVSK